MTMIDVKRNYRSTDVTILRSLTFEGKFIKIHKFWQAGLQSKILRIIRHVFFAKLCVHVIFISGRKLSQKVTGSEFLNTEITCYSMGEF